MAEQRWLARFTLQTDWPSDIPNPEGFEAVDWEMRAELSFIPHAGMMLAIGDDDLRKVNEVYWLSAKPNEIEVDFGDDFDSEHPQKLEYWLRCGWSSKDLPDGQQPRKRKPRKAVANG